jgi:glycosyltransferase involved in cell wall biosynthesis
MTQTVTSQTPAQVGTKRVLRINYIMPRPNLSGGIKSSKLIAEAMVRRGHEVRLIFPVKFKPLPSVLHPRRYLQTMLRRFKVLVERREHHLVQSTAELMPVQHYCVQAEHVPDADVTIASWWETMESMAGWPQSKGIKIHYIRGYEVFHHERERVEAVYRLDVVKVVNGRWMRRVMLQEYGKDAVLVPNGVDWSQFGSGVRSKNGAGTVGFVYAPTRLKGAHTAFEAIRIVQRMLPQTRVVSFGATPLKREEKLPANFEFHLKPAQGQIADIYRSAHCWIVPSISEGLPMPGLEAAGCRCPLVATRCGGAEDYVQHGINGYLVPVEDPQQMADRILDLLQAGEEKWGQMSDASYRIAQMFNWDRSAELLEDVLFKAAANSAI